MRRRLLITLVVVCVGSASVAADDGPVGEARVLFLKGEYVRAAEVLQKTLAADGKSARAAELLSELDLELGRFDEAARRCEEFLRSAPRQTGVRTKLAWALYRRGDLDRAYREARKVQVLDPTNLSARYLEALIQHDRGARLVAKRVFETFVDVYQDTPNEKLSAEDLTTIGRACTCFALADRNPRMLRTIVNEVYPAAVKKDRLYTPALIASGELLLAKYNTGEARREFEAALRVNPKHPLALVGLARCELSRRQFPEAQGYVEKAQKVAPKLPEVLMLDATLSVYEQDFEAALGTAQTVLGINGNHQEALGLAAACFRQLGRTDDYAAAEKRALTVNPKCSVFYETVASVLITRHRDGEAEGLLRKAMELSPNDSGPASLLGLLLMRLGREKEAYAILNAAFKMDSFNVLVFNTLNLLEKMEDFETRKTEHFTIRVHPKADRVLVDYVVEYMERIYPEVVANYRHEPPHTLIEIFPQHRMFSVRTAGVPNVGTVGACLGPTIVMDSPVVGRPGMFNWADVLRHEFTHAVTLSATDMKISHWFTEALAVSEERRPWRYEWNQMLVDALDRDELMPVTRLNHAFTRARTQRRRQLAYAQSYLVARFITETWGRHKLVEMLAHYRKGEDTAQVILSAFGMKPEDFDGKFRVFASGFASGWKLSPGPLIREQGEVEKRIEQNPTDAELHLELSRIKLARRDVTGAALSVQEALKLKPEDARVHAALGMVRLHQRNASEARKAFEKALVRNPAETAAVRGMLQVCRLEKKEDEVLTYLGKLRSLEPLNPGIYRAMAKILLKKGEERGAVDCLSKAAEYDSQDYHSRRELVRLMMERTDYHSAAKYIDEAVAIWPYDRKIHEWGAVAFAKLGKVERAEREKALIPHSKDYRPSAAPERPERPVEH